jgi:hypothetical protein
MDPRTEFRGPADLEAVVGMSGDSSEAEPVRINGFEWDLSKKQPRRVPHDPNNRNAAVWRAWNSI